MEELLSPILNSGETDSPRLAKGLIPSASIHSISSILSIESISSDSLSHTEDNVFFHEYTKDNEEDKKESDEYLDNLTCPDCPEEEEEEGKGEGTTPLEEVSLLEMYKRGSVGMKTGLTRRHSMTGNSRISKSNSFKKMQRPVVALRQPQLSNQAEEGIEEKLKKVARKAAYQSGGQVAGPTSRKKGLSPSPSCSFGKGDKVKKPGGVSHASSVEQGDRTRPQRDSFSLLSPLSPHELEEDAIATRLQRDSSGSFSRADIDKKVSSLRTSNSRGEADYQEVKLKRDGSGSFTRQDIEKKTLELRKSREKEKDLERKESFEKHNSIETKVEGAVERSEGQRESVSGRVRKKSSERRLIVTDSAKSPNERKNSNERRTSNACELPAFPAHRAPYGAKRRNSIGTPAMGDPLFSFQRREMMKLETGPQESAYKSQAKSKRFKVILLGDPAVGKSALLSRHIYGIWPAQWVPAVQPEPILITQEELNTELEIWDTAGAKEYDSIRQFTFLRVNVFLVCYSVANRESLSNAIMKWIPMAQNFSSKARVVLVALKTDMRDQSKKGLPNHLRPISADEGKRVASDMGVEYIEYKLSESCDIFFSNVTFMIRTNRGENIVPKEPSDLMLSPLDINHEDPLQTSNDAPNDVNNDARNDADEVENNDLDNDDVF